MVVAAVKKSQLAAIRFVDAGLRRRMRSRPIVHKISRSVTHNGSVTACGMGQSLAAVIGDAYPVRMIRYRVIGARRDVNPAVRLVNRKQGANFPLAYGQSSQQLSVGGVEVEVSVTVALAEPEKRSVFKPARLVDYRHPGVAGLAQNGALADTQIEPPLL